MLVQYKKLVTVDNIYQALLDFQECFPHLKEKIRDFQEYAEKLYKSANTYVMLYEKKGVGISIFYANDQVSYCGYISLIGIKKQFQKCHFGGKLLKFSESIMEQQGMKKARLEVDCDNSNAQDFYCHMGFCRKEQASDHSWFMEKGLS